MKSFKQFIESEKPKDLRLEYIHNTHGSHAKKSKEEYISNTHGSHAKISNRKKLKENTEQHPSLEEHYLQHDENKNIFDSIKEKNEESAKEIDKLHKSHPVNEKALDHLSYYTIGSTDITDELLNAHRHAILHGNNSKYEHPLHVKDVIEGLDKHAFTPAKHDLETHSGVKYNIHDYRRDGVSKHGNPVYEHPTYMSSSTNRGIARHFSEDDGSYEGDQHGHHHIFHFHIKKGTPISVVGKHSAHPSEHEVLIHRGNADPNNKTYLEHRGTKTYSDKSGRTVHVHNINVIPQSEVKKD